MPFPFSALFFFPPEYTLSCENNYQRSFLKNLFQASSGLLIIYDHKFKYLYFMAVKSTAILHLLV